MIEFGVLGVVTATRDGHPLTNPSPKLRRLLALLLSRGGRDMAASELAEAVWEGRPPRTARKTLQFHVHHLRRWLGDPGLLLHDGDGYRAVVDPASLDSLRFAMLVGQARADRVEGRLGRASDLFRSALALWRGEPYADISIGMFLLSEVDRLRAERLSAQSAAFAVDLDLGRHQEVVTELAELGAQHPYREDFTAMVMLALHRCGRRADALEVFRRTRSTLSDDLGIEPGALLAGLHQSILRDDDQLRRIAVAEIGSIVPTGPIALAPDPADSARTRVLPPAQLPADTVAFTGRTAQLRALDKLRAGLTAAPVDGSTSRAVVIAAITGPPGVGKTALAVHWAHQVAKHFPDGQLHVNLRGFGSTAPLDPQEALRGFLDALGASPQSIPTGLTAQTALYRSMLAHQRVLIVLDNARDADQVRPLVPGSAGCLVLVTSRDRLPGMVGADGARPVPLDVPTLNEARQLLHRRLGSARPEGGRAHLDAIIEACGRLPLALALLVGRAATQPTLSVADLVAELGDARTRLEALAVGDASTDIRAVFSWSYHALSTAAARLFRLLGLADGPDIGVTAAACLSRASRSQTVATLAELTRSNMVVEAAPGRYVLHDLLRSYAIERAQLEDSHDERRDATGRLLDHYSRSAFLAAEHLYPHRYVGALKPPPPGTATDEIGAYAQAMHWFGVEQASLAAAQQQSAAEGWDRHAWQLALSMSLYFDRRGFVAEKLVAIGVALAAAERLADQAAQALLHLRLADAYRLLHRIEQSYHHFAQSENAFIALDDLTGRGHVYLNRALTLERDGRLNDALAASEHALRLFRSTGNPSGQAKALNNIGWFHARLDHPAQAIAHCARALALLQELGDRFGQALTLDSLGYAYHRHGDHAQAIEHYHRAVECWHELGDRSWQADVLIRLAECHHDAGHRARARQAWQQAADLLAELHDHRAEQIRALARA